MPFSSGTYTPTNGPHTGAEIWSDAAGAEPPFNEIDPTQFDDFSNDLAQALTRCLLKDGSQTVSANLPLSGFKLTNLGDAVAADDAANLGQVQAGDYNWIGSLSGSTSELTASLSPAPAAYTPGLTVLGISTINAEAGATLNLNDLGALPIVRDEASAALLEGDIVSGQVVTLVYDAGGGGKWRFTTTSPINKSTNLGLGSAILNNLTASRPLALDAQKVIESPTPADFRSTIAAARSGPNDDITALDAINLTIWSPVLSAANAMVITDLQIRQALYQIVGGYVQFNITAQFTIAGTPSNFIYIPMPFFGNSHNAACSYVCGLEDGGGATVPNNGRWRYDAAANRIQVFKPGLANFALGPNAAINIDGKYRA